MDEKSGVIQPNLPSEVDRSEIDTRRVAKPQKWWKIGGQDVSHVSVDIDTKSESETSSIDQSGSHLVRNVNNVFEAAEATEIYKPIKGFEGTHRFDPNATWTNEEEAALVRRVCSSRYSRKLHLIFKPA